MNKWLLFNYKVPNEPSARRVYVWRKLKGMGALLLHDAVWVLPDSPRTRENLQWLAGEIAEMAGGQAMLWEAAPVFTGKDVDLVQQFGRQVDALYEEILRKLRGRKPDLAALSRLFQQVNQQDYFQSETGRKVREALLERRRKGET